MKDLLKFIDYCRAKINKDCEICIFSKDINEFELQASLLKKGLIYKQNIIVCRDDIVLSKHKGNMIVDRFCDDFNEAIK